MFELTTHCCAESLEQADALLHEDKKNVILGGLLWMRLGTRKYHTGIDLSGLGLDQVTDTGQEIEIGAMTCLRQIETSPLLAGAFGPVLREAVSPIVGVQFRNLATVGGSVFSRFNFSDLATALLVLDTKVHLYRSGVRDLADFLAASPGRDILVKLSIPKQEMTTTYQCIRKTATDFPVLAAAFSRRKEGWKIAYGARPARAKLALKTADVIAAAAAKEDQMQDTLDKAQAVLMEELGFGTDARGGKAYREHLAGVLLKRGMAALC